MLEPEARWFARWAALVSGTAADSVPGSALFTDLALEEPTLSLPPKLSAEDLLDQYASFASIDALRLARYLAAAPLNLPVMRLVQRTMLPESKTSVLAEVFLGGLLHQQYNHAKTMPHPDEVEYDFALGVRDLLLAQFPSHERLAVLSGVSDFIALRLGAPIDFRALLSGEPSAAAWLERDLPFARVALQVLTSLGGRYQEAAERLRTRSVTLGVDLPTTAVSPTPGDLVSAETGPAVPSADLEAPPPAARTPSEVTTIRQPDLFGGVPLRNPYFTGREDLLARLHDALERGTTVTAHVPHVLHGLGGVGKTQLAIEYIYRYAANYDLVWWVPAQDEGMVRRSLAELADAMGIDTGADVDETILNVLEALRTRRSHQRWLLVFDNADRPEGVLNFLPVPIGHVLITSRNPYWSDVCAPIEVEVLGRDESVALLKRRGSAISDGDANDLAEQLGDLPVALDQAAAWQSETGIPVHDLVRFVGERPRQFLDQSRPTTSSLTVAAAWHLAISRLRDQSPGAAQLLELCAFFGPDPIPVSLLWAGRHAALSGPVALVLRDDIALRRAIREIGRHALARVDAQRDRIEVHRLVQAVLREQVSPDDPESARDMVHDILGQAIPGDPDNPATWDRHAAAAAHIEPSGLVDAKTDAGRQAVLDHIRYLQLRGDYRRGRQLAETALARWQETLGPDNRLTQTARRYLASMPQQPTHMA